jgi:hypothetical protein
MGKQSFVNQFKNTRRSVKLQSGKKGRNAAGNMNKLSGGRRPWGKAELGEKAKGGRQK